MTNPFLHFRRSGLPDYYCVAKPCDKSFLYFVPKRLRVFSPNVELHKALKSSRLIGDGNIPVCVEEWLLVDAYLEVSGERTFDLLNRADALRLKQVQEYMAVCSSVHTLPFLHNLLFG